MDGLKQSYQNVNKALSTLEEALLYKPPVKDEMLEDQLRDSRIQRFEYSLDALWKFARKYLEQYHLLVLNTPKPILKALFKTKICDEQETALFLLMVDMRNKTSHMYFEEIALQLDKDLKKYYQIMRDAVDRMSAHMNKED